jgi:hypothetical protein
VRIRTAPAAALTALALLAAGCGAESPDLFAVQRSGQGPNANLRLVVNDGGTVTCNGHPHPLPGDQLLKAREMTRALADQAQLHLVLPPGPNSVLSYRVRLEAGTVQFADTSANLPMSFTDVEVFTKDVSEGVCGLRR